MKSIVKDKDTLSRKCEPVSLFEGLQLGDILMKELDKHSNGVGLAANQIGINKRVCVIRVTKPIILVNPEIVESSGATSFEEGCLSFPGDYVLTKRFSFIKVKADNHKEELSFNFIDSELECVCVQHEIDHLDGITMYERQLRKTKDGNTLHTSKKEKN
tara:strand:- start:14 stop:490 length:477 start_codon:yes stop_codon:yes gene_type:complete